MKYRRGVVSVLGMTFFSGREEHGVRNWRKAYIDALNVVQCSKPISVSYSPDIELCVRIRDRGENFVILLNENFPFRGEESIC